jgi:hypothetical protein
MQETMEAGAKSRAKRRVRIDTKTSLLKSIEVWMAICARAGGARGARGASGAG